MSLSHTNLTWDEYQKLAREGKVGALPKPSINAAAPTTGSGSPLKQTTKSTSPRSSSSSSSEGGTIVVAQRRSTQMAANKAVSGSSVNSNTAASKKGNGGKAPSKGGPAVNTRSKKSIV